MDNIYKFQTLCKQLFQIQTNGNVLKLIDKKITPSKSMG